MPHSTAGYAALLTGYVGWGLFPLYWALLKHVPALEVLLHRMLWSVPFLALLVVISAHRRQQVAQAVRSRAEIKWLAASGLVIAFNWGIYIWAVANARVIEASMGYFLTPLLHVLAGVIVYRESLDRSKVIALSCAAAGVAYYMLVTAVVPWVSLAVGVSFAAYGLIRKQMATNPVPGLLIEVLLLLPFTLAAILWLHHYDEAAFLNQDRSTDWWLILGGPVTVVPLAFFTAGARLLPLTSVGILFYLTPSLQFLCGILILGETLDLNKLLAFTGIWIGLIIFSYSLLCGARSAAIR